MPAAEYAGLARCPDIIIWHKKTSFGPNQKKPPEANPKVFSVIDI